MIKVAHFRSSNFVGGPEKQILTHLAALNSRAIATFLISYDEPGGRELRAIAESLGCKVLLLAPSIKAFLSNLKKLNEFIREHEINILCAHDYKCELYALAAKSGYVDAGLNRRTVKRIGFSRGATAESIKLKFYSWLDSYLIRFNHQVVAVSDSQKQKLLDNGVKENAIVVVKNALTKEFRDIAEESNTRAALGIDADDFVLFCAGRLSHEKGQAYLIDACLRLMLKYPQLRLVVAGDGPDRAALEQRVQQSENVDRVHFLGHKPSIHYWMQSSQLLVLPSLSEGMPNVVIEAMSEDLCVLATAVGGLPSMIEHGVNGFLCEAGDADQLADAIEYGLLDPDTVSAVGAHAGELCRSAYDPERQTDRLVAIYQSLLVESKP